MSEMIDRAQGAVLILMALVLIFLAAYLALTIFVRLAERRGRELLELDFVARMGWDPAIGRPATLREAIFQGMNDRNAVVPGMHDSGDVVQIHVVNYLRQRFNRALLAAGTESERQVVRSLAEKLGIMPKENA